MTEHKTLVEALLAFQAEAPTLPKDTVNPHFKSKFTSLDTIVETVRPLLVKHGLTWSAFPCTGENGEPHLRYELAHISGELKSSYMPLLLGKADMQGLGSALTYARRYSITAVLNLVADEDDDGNGAARVQGQQPKADLSPTLASEPQRRLIYAKAGANGLGPSEMANIIKVTSGGEAGLFETENEAAQWLERAMPKLPARLVNPIVKNIEAEGKVTA